MQMKVNKINLKLKRKIKLDSLKIGVAKITPIGTINIEENGTYDVTNYNEAIVNTPISSGEIEITSNGEYDVTNYETANVNCPNDLDWSAIGYNARPETITEGYNVAKNINDTYDFSKSNTASAFSNRKDLIIFPKKEFTNSISLYQGFVNCSGLLEIELNAPKVTILSQAFTSCTNLKKAKIKSNSGTIISTSACFSGCNQLKEIDLSECNLSNCTTMNEMFYQCIVLPSITLNNTSKATTMASMFYYCRALKVAPQMDTSNVTSMSQMFYSCTNLQSVPIYNTSKVTNFGNTFSGCSDLTDESLNNIMQMCINATSYTGTKTLKQLGLSNQQATICQSLSNYEAFLNANWTTGY